MDGTSPWNSISRSVSWPGRWLFSRWIFDAAGRIAETIDPAGTRTSTAFDDLGRVTKTIENFTGAVTPGDADTDKTTLFSYSLDGMLSMLTVKNPITGDQVTRWVYGTTLSNSGVASSTLLRAKIFPDSDDATNPLGSGSDGVFDRIEYKYNRQGEATEERNQNITIHAYLYDLLGQLVEDRVTNPGVGIDASIRRIKTTWDDLGRRSKVSSYNSPTSGSVINEVKFTYDDFGQLKEDIQAHAGATGASTPKVTYAYENGTGNSVRLKSTAYPETNRGTSLVYGAAGTAGDMLSRVTGVWDFQNTGVLAEYDYLGAGTFVRTGYADIGMELTYLKQGSETDGDAGDPYNGLDRFGRIQDQRWLKTSTGRGGQSRGSVPNNRH